jgi:hypothetical protein
MNYTQSAPPAGPAPIQFHDAKEQGVKFQLHIGASSILLIFVTLCLVSFAVLSIVSANADSKLTGKVLERSEEYYNACNTAQAALATMDVALAEAYRNASTREEYYNSLGAAENYSFEVSVNSSQVLSVAVQVLYPEEAGDPFYEITTWRVISAAPAGTTIE